ncbi:MAG: DUF4625 domain-containing protein, partial [Cytophagales bacterium]|nr:DUF4625 domain-containing protein [Cytophagales bacterium]
MKRLTLLLMICSGFWACDSDEADLEKPVASNIQLSTTKETVNGKELFVLHLGEPIAFKAGFSDNEGLSYYKLDFHWAAGHSHSHSHREARVQAKAGNVPQK